jgi:predicted DNA-binding antitoxin AbrB/MazE fold protein
MTITVDATYEQGVLKPVQPLPFAEHEKVRLTVEPQAAAQDQIESAGATPQPPIWERIVALTRDLPPEVIEGLPVDGASQHDHYIYGTPKRPE